MVITRLTERMQLSPRLWLALLVAIAGFAFYALLLHTSPLAILPGYPAVIVAFALWLIAPGWLLQRTLFASRTTGLIEQITVAFLTSLALAALPGLVALRLHWSIDAFALSYAALASIASGLSLLWRRDEGEAASEPDELSAEEEPRQRSFRSHLPLLFLLAVPLLAVATSPWWAGDRVSRDSDDWVYMSYVTEYVGSDALDASRPFLDTRPGQFGRMQFNVWVVMEALVADSAGVEPLSLLLDYLPPLMTLLVAAAAYTLARGLFRSTPLALLASLFVLLYGVLDLAPHEGYGRNIFLRVGEDKMVASYILLPIGLLLGARLLSLPNAKRGLGLLLVIAALFVTHPIALIFLGVAMGSLAVLHVLVERSVRATGTAALFILPWMLVGLGLLASSWLGRGRVLIIDEPFRRQYHIADVFDGFIVGSYHLILHPFMLAAILLAVPLWLISRHSIAHQLLAATVTGVLVFVFFPPIATLVADEVSEEALWRLPWLIPVPLILAYAAHDVANRVHRRWPGGWAVSRRVLVSTRYASIAAVAVIAGSAFLVQEQYLRADGGALYNWTSENALLPGNDRSIFLGGIDYAFAEIWRIPPEEEQLFDYLDRKLPSNSVVLAEPTWLHHMIPGVLTEIYAFDFVVIVGPGQGRNAVKAFGDGTITPTELEAVVDRYGIDYIVVREVQPANDTVRAFDRALWLQEISPYQIYEVQ